MTPPEIPLIGGFVIFCRVGGCLMTAPGFSNDRIPVRSRLYLALGVSVAMTPALIESLPKTDLTLPSLMIAGLLSETIIGVALGLLSRFYLLALETLATSVAMSFGLGNIFGGAIAETEAAPPLASFIVTAAITLLFVTDLHLELIRGLSLSYDSAPALAAPDAAALLEELTHALTQSHLLALRICSPFLLFALIVNLAVGFLSRLTPQAQVYFLSGPLTIFLGLYAFFALSPDFFTAFISHFSDQVLRG
ncbi:flagellar biosynthetic protein FliR [Methylocystis parvus]|uniref:Flagellar biosynthetic protein FliR n=1 Tax=Methylocystis parvus TaxID=134 RepID=A0A6B8MBK2_9HYPH|nr:flagellar biosynthetic protein FliR [Methylocystis parvus]QGM98000.1 flagellar biosynthetic protein FliR [Methylocystis parvus]WBK01684.1 flagellar biosynthetic protein FliR [Methylocystis parvus OBBP]